MEDLNSQQEKIDMRIRQQEIDFDQKVKKMRLKISQENPTGSSGLNFQAYDETIDKLEADMN